MAIDSGVLLPGVVKFSSFHIGLYLAHRLIGLQQVWGLGYGQPVMSVRYKMVLFATLINNDIYRSFVTCRREHVVAHHVKFYGYDNKVLTYIIM